MNVLDENIRHDQGIQLRQWRIRFRYLTEDIAPSGTQDPDILPLLIRLKQPVFFTHDRDYFKRELAHTRYCLVWLDVFDGDAAGFIRAFLKHPDFNTSARRMGRVVRIRKDGLHFWRQGQQGLHTSRWLRRV